MPQKNLEIGQQRTRLQQKTRETREWNVYQRQREKLGLIYQKRKGKHSGNDTLEYLTVASDKECELRKQELEFKMEQEKSAAQQTIMLQSILLLMVITLV